MTKIRLKSAPRKTQVSRAKVRSIMSRLFGKTTPAVKKNNIRKAIRKTSSRKAA